jgi:L-aspartate oxidase
VTSDEDSFELHVRDTLEAGAGLCDEAVVRTIVTEGPERIRELAELGLHFDEREISGHRELDLGKEGGHSKRRVLHVQDVTGKEIEETLLRELARFQSGGIDLLENHMAVDLITAAKLGFATEDRCLGVYVLDEKTGEVETIRSERIVLATGGCQSLFCLSNGYMTGDGVAMSGEQGWRSANMSSSIFPTCLFSSQANHFSFQAVQPGGAFCNNRGEDFMKRYDERGSLAPRDVVVARDRRRVKRSGAKYVFFGYGRARPIYSGVSRTLREHACGSASTCETGDTSCAGSHYQCGGIKRT